MGFAKELEIAELAVQRAALLTRRVFREKSKMTTSKDDKSPVTIGDFGAQALILNALGKQFPDDAIVAEEESSLLRESEDIRKQIWNLVKDTKLNDEDSESKLHGSISSERAMLDVIDKGDSPGGDKGRIWALDPIDGTKGFIRGGQYAICLALIVDGQVVVGAMACPNLQIDQSGDIRNSIDISQNIESKGVLVSAMVGCGTNSRPMNEGALMPSKNISVKDMENVKEAVFCESVEASHSSHDDSFKIAERLGISRPGVRLDSQAKYSVLAHGIGDIYLRLPVRKDYEEKIWDHAAGTIIVLEAGGEVTDARGERLDFSKGRTLKANTGVVAASKKIHSHVVKAVRETIDI